MGVVGSIGYNLSQREKSLTRERMVYLQELRTIGYVPKIIDFLDYVPLYQIEKDWDQFMQSSLAHKLRAVGVDHSEIQAILFDTFCDEFLSKY